MDWKGFYHRLVGWLHRVEVRRRTELALAASALIHISVIIALGGSQATGRTEKPADALFAPQTISVTLAMGIPSAQVVQNKETPRPIPASDSVETKGAPVPGASNAASDEGDKALISSPITDTTYYSSKELDTGPVARTQVLLQLDGLDQFSGLGIIKLSLWINEAGMVDSAVIDFSNMPSVYTEKIRQQFLQTLFLPGERKNKKVRSLQKVVVEFPPLYLATQPTPLR